MVRTPNDIYDELLVMQCQDGERDALDRLVGRWTPRFRSRATQLIGDRDGANDVVQETWIAIVRGVNRLRDPAYFPGWSHRILKNKASDWIRKRQSQRRLIDNVEQRHVSGNESRHDRDGADADDVAALRTAFDRMPADDRLLLSMRFIENMSAVQISRVLESPLNTVRSRINRLRKSLRETTTVQRQGECHEKS